MRTLIINSMFANALYRRCADELGKLPGMELTMMTVDEWRMNGRPMKFDPLAADAPYRTIVGEAGWKGFENRGFYKRGLVEAFRQSKPEVLFLMEEPFSVFAAEILAVKSILAPQIPVVNFTWNNLSLEVFDYRPSFFYRNVARRVLPRIDYALTANSDGVNVLREAGFVKPVKVVGYGVDTQSYSTLRPERRSDIRARLGVGEDETLIGYVGRLIEMKGVDLLIDAIAHIQRTGKHKLKLLLLGGGEDERAILDRARQKGVSEILRHVNVVPQSHVPDYMHAIDVLVLPSRRVGMWAEQFGRVLVEAMAAGKIVVGSSSGAIPEVIGEAGYVFQENDAQDLERVLRDVLALGVDEKEVLRAKAIDRATIQYSWSRFAQDAHSAIDFVYQNSRKVRT